MGNFTYRGGREDKVSGRTAKLKTSSSPCITYIFGKTQLFVCWFGWLRLSCPNQRTYHNISHFESQTSLDMLLLWGCCVFTAHGVCLLLLRTAAKTKLTPTSVFDRMYTCHGKTKFSTSAIPLRYSHSPRISGRRYPLKRTATLKMSF